MVAEAANLFLLFLRSVWRKGGVVGGGIRRARARGGEKEKNSRSFKFGSGNHPNHRNRRKRRHKMTEVADLEKGNAVVVV